MRNVAKPVILLAVLGVGALLFVKLVLPELEKGDSGRRALPVPPPAPGLSGTVRASLQKASDLEAPERFREALDEYRGQPAESEIRLLYERRAEAVVRSMETHTESLLAEYLYQDATAFLDRYRSAWRGTTVANRIDTLLDEVREEQSEQVRSRMAEADALLEAGRYEAARESLRTDWQLEESYRNDLGRHAQLIERHIRIRTFERKATGRPDPPPAPPKIAKVAPSLPPTLPGLPDPDVKRLQDAKTLYAKARGLFDERKYDPATKATEELLEAYGDLKYVARKREAVAAMKLLSRHGRLGIGGLFHATSAKRLKGGRVRLVYAFENEGEELDWEAFKTIPHKDDGKFEPARAGARGTGVMTYLLRAFFKNDVRITCTTRPRASRTHGLAFCQQDLETRQIMLLVTNHWFVEGENYVKERPGHSLLMIGKGTNNDVPVDSPDIGFIFRGGTREKPQPDPGGELDIGFELKGNEMTGVVAYKSDQVTLRHQAVGDDGRGIQRVRPALFVVQNGVLFKRIRIEGVVHPDFERARISELLDRID
ncbi:MAG: hypothetical protein ACYSX0_07425 [Planctomycetota bacterium]|jgi:tetratricopeptide (TPR) repeat protein